MALLVLRLTKASKKTLNSVFFAIVKTVSSSSRVAAMYAVRQIYDNPQELIPVPEQMRHQRMEVIFMALEDVQVEPQILTGSLLLDFFKNVPPATRLDEEMNIEPRSLHPERVVSFE